MSEGVRGLGPLEDGATVVIIGGGPGGASCGIALKRFSQQMGRRVHVVLFEGKTFAGETHYNQCVGVLSPPIIQVLEEDLGVAFPWHLAQRTITGYVLHGDRRQIVLDGPGEPSYALRRILFDDYLLDQARERGVEVVHSRVTDVEIHDEDVTVYSESGMRRADVVVGAFGLDAGTAAALHASTGYRRPPFLDSIVTKVHPDEEMMAAFGDRIHAFLPPWSAVEFGAITPKGNHLTINIAGGRIDRRWMRRFLQAPAVMAVLPRLDFRHPRNPKDLQFFKGRFPIGPAERWYGDRYVMVGDAAGLVRPFKGKGVTSACQTGLWAAQTVLHVGISARAFRESYVPACRDILADLPYGRLMRWLTIAASDLRVLDAVLELAEHDAQLRRALFNAVSAHQTYRRIIWDTVSLHLLSRLGWAVTRALVGRLRRPAAPSLWRLPAPGG